MSDPQRLRTAPGSAVLDDPGTISPFLHDRGTVLYNPLTGASIAKDGEAFRALERIRDGNAPPADEAILDHLRAARFLIEDVDRESRKSHVLFLSLETCTVCNHRCPFCPVSVDPREREVMSTELFESIVDQTISVAGRDFVVFLSNYNEPTIDPSSKSGAVSSSRAGCPSRS